MSSYTPGPWHVSLDTDYQIYSPAEGHGIAMACTVDLKEIGVCELTGPKNRADAALISAAPEMRDALDAFLRAAWLTPETEMHAVLLKAVTLTAAALIKADGLSPEVNNHTPGPWRTGRPGNECRIYSPAEEHAIARTYGPYLNGIPIQERAGPRNRVDAALIAAAPEMKDALIAFLRVITTTPEAELQAALRNGLQQASAALRKAGGLDPTLWSCIKK